MRFRRFELILPCLKSSVISLIVTSFPVIQKEYVLNLTELGLIASIYYLFAFIGTIIWTFLNGRIARVAVFCIGGLLWSSCTFLLYLTNDFSSLIILICVIGLGAESTTIIIMNELLEFSDLSNRGKNQSYFWIINGLGTIVGWVIGGTFEGIYGISWKLPMIFIGLTAMCVTGLISFLFRSQSRGFPNSTNRNLATFLQKMDNKPTRELFRETISNRINMLAIIICIIFMPFNSNFNTWLQKFFIQSRNMTQSMASIAMVFVFSAAFLAQIVGGRLIDRYFREPPPKKIKLAVLATFISVPLLFFAFFIPWLIPPAAPTLNYIELAIYMLGRAMQDPTVFWTFFSLFLGFFASTLLSIILPLVVIDYNGPRTKILAINVLIIAFNSGWVLGPVLGGVIGDAYGLNVLFLIEPIVFIVIGFLFWKMYFAGKIEVGVLTQVPD